MILVDLNQVMISNLMVQIGTHTNVEVEEGLLRHMVFNTLRKHRRMFHKEYGELVICCDDKNYWRRQMFPYYKANRKAYRNASELDWNSIFATLNSIRDDIRNVFPYKVLQIDTAEADDIIGTIVHKIEGKVLLNDTSEPILILSGDKDFIQLHGYANVKQYDPIRERFIRHDNPDVYLAEHIAKGDRGDGVPNVLSADDTFVRPNGRQKPLRSTMLNNFMQEDTIPDQYKANYMRNKRLVDLGMIPQHITDQVVEAYNESNDKSRDQIFNYFVKHKMKNLIEHIGEF